MAGRFGAVGGRRGIGWLACGVAGGLAIAWFLLFAGGEAGSKADWFFGAAVFCVALTSLWQTAAVARQAAATARQAEARAAEAQERSARELEMVLERHRAEMDGQSQRARVERSHLVNQLQRQAVVEVSRAVSGHTRALASLWQEGARVLSSEDRDERERAMKPVFEQIGRAVTDFSVELGGALLVVDDEHLHRALEGVNEAVLLAVGVAEELYGDVVDGRPAEPDAVAEVQRLVHARAAEARRLAWSLLRTGLDETAEEVKTP